MKTTIHRLPSTVHRPLSSLLCLLALSAFSLSGFQPFLAAQAATTPPSLPEVAFRDIKAYAWVWDASAQAWQVIPSNEARIFDGTSWQPKKQFIGTLLIDGCYAVPAVSGRSVFLCFRKPGDFKTFKGLPEGESGFEVTKLEVTSGPRKNQLIRTAQLHRQGEASATFGDKREPITVQKTVRRDGTFHLIRVDTPLLPGRYALYLPDRAFEFETQ